MASSCCRPDYDALFGARTARRELAAYRRNGATGTAGRLVEVLRDAGIDGASVLEIGGGVGVIGAELLAHGASSLIEVEASLAYVEAARSEIERRGYGDRATFVHGDFVELEADVAAADVVALDRVVCCYLDWEALIGRSVDHARRLYALAYPRERWWTRLAVAAGRLVARLRSEVVPFTVHPEREIDAFIRASGFERVHLHRGLAWQTVTYRRVAASMPERS